MSGEFLPIFGSRPRTDDPGPGLGEADPQVVSVLPLQRLREVERELPVLLEIIERARHNPHDERTAEVMEAVRNFISTDVGVPGDVAVTAA